MVEEGPITPGCRPMVAEEPEEETESQGAKVTRRIWRAELEQMAQASDKEAGIRKATVELEWQITVEELKVRRCLTEPKGQGTSGGVESRGDGWTTTDQGGAGGTREPVE